jgi:excinuclease ABC subunit C
MQEIPKLKEDQLYFLKSLPKFSGIYRFINKDKVPIYIGKAKNIKNRVNSYFRDSPDKTKKLQALLKEARYLDVTITNTELEALLLEQHLIKETRPKYNVQFKDDKGYPWIKINTSDSFPSAKIFLGKKNDHAKYFGPYPSSHSVREVLNLIQKTFKLRNCSDSFFKNRSRPCMQYQIGRCSAPCVNLIGKNDYSKEVEATEMLLQGKSEDLIEGFYTSMDNYSKQESYELAALYRDKISALRDIQRNQSITGFSKERDAISLISKNGKTRIGVTHVNKGWITGHENFTQKTNGIEDCLLNTFIKERYLSDIHCPQTLILDNKIDQKQSIEDALSEFHGKTIKIITKPRGKDIGLLEISKSNTLLAVQRDSKGIGDISHILKSLTKQINAPKLIKIVESYDISHHSGSGAVGGCVVYSDRGKLVNKYRLFNISDINAGNDIASMKEVVTRRFKNNELNLEKPDLLLIDGGRTHLSAIEQTLKGLNIFDIAVISISKGARRKAEMDTVHKGDGSSFKVVKGSNVHLLLQEMRDETHRFSISNQKNKQSKISMSSSLDSIRGLGDVRKQILLRYFGSLEQIKRASKQDLKKVVGIGPKNAEVIYNNFH